MDLGIYSATRVESLCHYMLDPSEVFSVCIAQWGQWRRDIDNWGGGGGEAAYSYIRVNKP